MTLFFVLLAALTLCLPFVLPRLARRVGAKLAPAPTWLTWLAAGLLLLALVMPDIHISGETDTFQLHFVGGGLYTACLFVYFCRAFRLSLPLGYRLAALFAVVSALGVANELLEFSLTHLQIQPMDISDTSWDLVANTSGAFVGFGLLSLIKSIR